MYLNDVFHGFYELKPCRNRHREIGSSHTCYTYVHPRKCKKEKGGFLIKKPKGFHQPLGFHGGSGKRGSNPRPSAWEADALPTELLPHVGNYLLYQLTYLPHN